MGEEGAPRRPAGRSRRTQREKERRKAKRRMGALFHTARLLTLRHSAWIALLFTLARAGMNALTKTSLEAARRKKGVEVGVAKIQEEVWLVAIGSVLSVLGGCLLALSPSFEGCNLFDTSACYSNASSEEIPKEIMAYYLLEVGWYVSLVLKSAVGVGRGDSAVMEFHHLITLSLVIWSYVTGMTQVIGVVTFFIFNQSNPLLHLSMLSNYMEMRNARAFLFFLFAAVFFVSRIILLPVVVIQSTWFQMPLAVSQKEWTEGHSLVYTWYVVNALLIALWLLNVYWLKPIIRIIGRNLSGMDKGKPQDDTVTAEDASAKKGK